MASKQSIGNNRREFYKNRLAQKVQELTAIEEQLRGTLSRRDELKLEREAENLLKEIEGLEKKLSELDIENNNQNIHHLNLEKSFQKIDFSEARRIAKSLHNSFGYKSGAILFFLQKSIKQKGDFCIDEVFDLLREYNTSRESRSYLVDFGSPISELNQIEFSKTLAMYLSENSELPIDKTIEKLCSPLCGGSIIFIKIKKLDDVTEPKVFLDWFIDNFWQPLLNKAASKFQEYSYIRFIVALMSESEIFLNNSDLPPYFCQEETFESCKIIKLPLEDWTIEDIKRWLITYQGLSDSKSEELARKIHRKSEGTPDTICSILRERF